MDDDDRGFRCGVPILRVADVGAAVDHYRTAFGLEVGWVVREEGIASLSRAEAPAGRAHGL